MVPENHYKRIPRLVELNPRGETVCHGAGSPDGGFDFFSALNLLAKVGPMSTRRRTAFVGLNRRGEDTTPYLLSRPQTLEPTSIEFFDIYRRIGDSPIFGDLGGA